MDARPSYRRIAFATIIALIASIAAMGAQIAILAMLEEPGHHSIPDFFSFTIIFAFFALVLAVPIWPLSLIWAGLAYAIVGNLLLRLRLSAGWRGHMPWIAAGIIIGATTVVAMSLEGTFGTYHRLRGDILPMVTFWEQLLHLLAPGVLTGTVGALTWRALIKFERAKGSYRP